MSLSRSRFDQRFREHRIVIVPNVGPKSQGRYSVEVLDSLSVLGTCDTVDEAITLAEDYIEDLRESSTRGEQ